MTIEPVTELGAGGALRLPRARVAPLSVPPCDPFFERESGNLGADGR
ncbi:hypothetical protein FAGKG844_10052 [Frankia sp. AgKG'84/4]